MQTFTVPQNSAAVQKAAKPAGSAQPSPFIKQNLSKSIIKAAKKYLLAIGFEKKYVETLLSDARLEKVPNRVSRISSEKLLHMGYNEYRKLFKFDELFAKGMEFYRGCKENLKLSEEFIGTPKELTMAVLGSESAYGEIPGSYTALNVFLTRYQNNSDEKKKKSALYQLGCLLQIAQLYGKDAFEIKSSYAGAIGPMQFMPSNMLRYARDYGYENYEQLVSLEEAITLNAIHLKELGAMLDSDFKKNGKNWKAAHGYNPHDSQNYPRFITELAAFFREAIAKENGN